MNEKSINELYTSIQHLVEQKRLKEALTQLESYLWECKNHSLKAKLEQVQTSYNYMLQYMKEGIEDPERKKLYLKLLTDVLEIADQARILFLDEISTHYYHEYRRRRTREAAPYANGKLLSILESFNDDLAIASLFSEAKTDEALNLHENTLKYMFLQTWTDSAWSAADEAEAKEIQASSLVRPNDLCVLISAVTLSLMECFDLRKFMFLCLVYESEECQTSQRALIGITFTIHFYRERMELYPEIQNRIKYLVEEYFSFITDQGALYEQLLLCQETEKIDKKMREEIIPEIMKNASNLQNLKFGIEEFNEEKDDKNPEWEIKLSSGAIDKLKEINDLQMAGADVYMSTFSALKGFPFFKELHHWFYPFDEQQQEVMQILNKKKTEHALLDMLLSVGFFCNSDKYSLFFIMQQIPESQRNLMFSQFTDQQLSDFTEKKHLENLKSLAGCPMTIRTQYLQDLYRFFALNTHRTEFKNIFKEKIELQKLPILKGLLNRDSMLYPILNHHLKNENWKASIEIGQQIKRLNNRLCKHAEFYQKWGYAFQKEKRLDEAIANYLKADLFQPDNLWTNQHLATCYRMNRKFQKALHYYQKVEEVEPNNPNIVFYIGSCLTELKKYEEALNYFFKLDFIENDSRKAWRGIGWCFFMTQKYEQAMKYYTKLIERKPLMVDYLNAGHVAWALENIEKTISLYAKALEMSKSKDEFLDIFYNDKNYLIAQGIKKEDMPLIIDLL